MTTGDSAWAAFAGVMMFLIGSLNAIWGLGGVLNDGVVVVGGHGPIIASVELWGAVHLVMGVILAITGVGLLRGSDGARWVAVFFLVVNAVAQVVWFPAAPLWAFLIIILDVVIIYQLTARWGAQASWS